MKQQMRQDIERKYYIAVNVRFEKSAMTKQRRKHGVIRTIENCTIAARVYNRDDKEKYEDGKCAGVRNSGEEPIDECKKCKLCFWYEEET